MNSFLSKSVLTHCEIQLASSKIWTLVADSISYNDASTFCLGVACQNKYITSELIETSVCLNTSQPNDLC